MNKTMIMIIFAIFAIILCSSSLGVGIYIYFATTIDKTPKSPKIFKRTHETDAGCCGGDGGQPHELICPEGSFVNEFYGGFGAYIDRIGVKCSNGNDLGTRGSDAKVDNIFSTQATKGFNKIQVKSGDNVDNLNFFSNNINFGSVGGKGGKGPHDLNCGNGKIMGLKLRSGDRIDRIQLVCGKEQ